MNTVLRHILVSIILLMLIPMMACKKRCQEQPEVRFETVVGTQWRMVEAMGLTSVESRLDNFNFYVWEFYDDNTGKAWWVKDNVMNEDAPDLLIDWYVVPDSDVFYIQLHNARSFEETDDPVIQYGVDLGYDLQMESNSGYSLRFVPFTGAVHPDVDCTF